MTISPGHMSNGQQTSADEHAPYEPVKPYRADIDAAERACAARDESELLGCPFCERSARYTEIDCPPIGVRYGVQCMECECSCDYRERTKAGAALKWNWRKLATRPAASDGAREALATPPPWSISDVRTVEGEYMVVGGVGQEFGLIASCPEKADAEFIVRLRHQCDVQIEQESVAWRWNTAADQRWRVTIARPAPSERTAFDKIEPLYVGTSAVPSAQREGGK